MGRECICLSTLLLLLLLFGFVDRNIIRQLPAKEKEKRKSSENPGNPGGWAGRGWARLGWGRRVGK